MAQTKTTEKAKGRPVGKKEKQAGEKKTLQKEAPAKEKPAEKKKEVEKEKKEKTVEQKKADKVKEKLKRKKLPTFRGRFGKKWLRKKSIEKWQKWRYPRGIDISLKKEDGFLPAIGFRTPKGIRHLHPSGMQEVTVSNPAQVALVSGFKALRIQSTVGRKTRKQIISKAKELGLKILN